MSTASTNMSLQAAKNLELLSVSSILIDHMKSIIARRPQHATIVQQLEDEKELKKQANLFLNLLYSTQGLVKEPSHHQYAVKCSAWLTVKKIFYHMHYISRADLEAMNVLIESIDETYILKLFKRHPGSFFEYKNHKITSEAKPYTPEACAVTSNLLNTLFNLVVEINLDFIKDNFLAA